MTVRIAILVEGDTEKAFRKPLIAFLEERLAGHMPALKFISADGRIAKGEKLKKQVANLLNTVSDHVLALTDVYTGTSPPDFKDASDARARMTEWVGREPRFHPHAAQYDFEAWLLPFWPRIQKLAGSNRQPPSTHPEHVNHDKPPARILGEVFRTGTAGRRYLKSRDAVVILKDQNIATSAERCPGLKAFLDTILELCGGEPL